MEQEPNYEEAIQRLGSQVSGGVLIKTAASPQTSFSSGSNASFMSKLNGNHMYIVIPIVITIIMFFWSPAILHVDLPLPKPEDVDPANPQPTSELSKSRLFISIIAITAALIGGLYMYNAKRKPV
jgi:hypothetical protein